MRIAMIGGRYGASVTEWNEFRAIAPQMLREAMRGEPIVDLRKMYDAAAMRATGFTYQSISRR